ncbi:MAG: LEA type 2 family protein [Bacteroidota bacterium]
MRSKVFILLVFIVATSCLPKDSVQLRDVTNFSLALGESETLSGDAVFYNPNSSRMKLREVKIDVYLDGNKSAFVDQNTHVVAKPKSEFTIPVTLKLADGVRIKDLALRYADGKEI